MLKVCRGVQPREQGSLIAQPPNYILDQEEFVTASFVTVILVVWDYQGMLEVSVVPESHMAVVEPLPGTGLKLQAGSSQEGQN